MYKPWFRQALRLPYSRDPHEAGCNMLGSFEADNVPFLLPQSLSDEHMHVEGPSGSGKTAAMTMLLEQIAAREDRSIVAIDMKGDSNELLAAVTQSDMPVRWFIDRVGYSTHTFNLFEQRYWKLLTPSQKSATLGAALGTITTMAGYGTQWFQGASHIVPQLVFERTDVKTFRGLAEAVHHFVIHGKRDDLHSDIRAAGLQAYLDIRRVGSVQALNMVGNPGGIDICSLFEQPQVLYVALPSAGNHAMAGVICRLLLGALFDAAAVARRLVNVSVFVDEWHRAIAGGLLETVLTQARSCDVSLLMANQTINALDTKDTDFRPIMKACCRCHWLFGLGSPAEQAEFAKTSGFAKTIDRSITRQYEIGIYQACSVTSRNVEIERYALNEVKRICADPHLSFFTSSGDASLYQYAGFTQAVKSDFHITAEEYERRKRMPWPEPTPECIVTEMPSIVEPEPEPEPPPIEVIGRPKPRSPKPRGSKE